MATKKGKKKPVSPTLALFADFEETGNGPEPSPTYFTELPVIQGTGPAAGGGGCAMPDEGAGAGVKLYFRPGLHTEAVLEGLQQALKHECTVVQIDLGCALHVDWEVLAEPLLRHLVQEKLVAVQVPNLKVSHVKGKCKGALLDLVRQQVGKNISLFHRKFKTHQFLNTDFIIDKIRAAAENLQDTDNKPNKVKDAIKILKGLEESECSNSALLESQEFRAAVIRAYKMVRKKGRFEKKLKRRLNMFKGDEDDEEEEEEETPKRKRFKHSLPVPESTISDSSDSSDLDTELPPNPGGSNVNLDSSPPGPNGSNNSVSPSPSPDPNPNPEPEPSNSASKQVPDDQKTNAPETSPSPSPSPTPPQRGYVQKCYVCRQRFYTASKKRTTPATLHYKRMCIPCAEFNWKKRHQVNDLSGMVAVVTGGRIKIGYHIVLKLLRCGCKVIATTRFPHDAAKVFAQESDYNSWADRLTIYPLDLKNADSIYKFTNYLKRTLDKLDILINNAAQTIHRPVEFYRHLLDYEQLSMHALPEAQQRLLVGRGINLNLGLTSKDHAASQSAEEDNVTKRGNASDKETLPDEKPTKTECSDPVVEMPDECSNTVTEDLSSNTGSPIVAPHTSTDVAHLAPPTQMCAVPPMRMSSFEREALFPSGRFDTDGQQLDLRRTNTWRTVLDDVPVGELLEVMMVNTVAPFILNKELKDLMMKSAEPRKFVVNVSAMEGQFSRQAKTEYHPHTNMAKAALNMMTRTAALSYRNDDIFMTSVDTGWVTDERPFHMARHEERKGFILPLDVVDGATRVLDPILDGLTSETEPHYAVFLKDYRPYPW